jgi:hypothetical protein
LSEAFVDADRAIAKDVHEELSLGVDLVGWYPEVYVMETSHAIHYGFSSNAGQTMWRHFGASPNRGWP